MNYQELIASIELWFHAHLYEFFISVIVAILFLISKKVVRRLVQRHARTHNFDKSRMLYVGKITGMVNLIFWTALLGFVWEISLSGLSFYFASIFTVVGVALFANWSVLSNMTASVVLFFFFPHRIGQTVKIQDGDNSIEGTILDITMFYIEIETTEGNVVSYPNNLAMQKAIVNKKTGSDTIA
ncbi:MAG: mechanosensitive ion channel family protein [Roseivirga sp.]